MITHQKALVMVALVGAASSSFVDVTEDVLPAYTQSSIPLLDITKTPMPAGVCTLDANNDGFPDLYFVSGQTFANALMLNDGTGVFGVVSEEWGLVYQENSAVSCLAVDLDNDGCDDLVLTGAFTGGNFTGNLLLKNNYCSSEGNSTSFTDVTPQILRDWPYTVSSSATDFDNDGLLDLYVSSLPYLDLTNFPGPAPLSSFPGSSLLLHNTGDFTFEDISASSRANNATCPCMTVLMDYDKDGLNDIVAINCGNDVIQSFDMQLYRNTGNLTFEDVTNHTGFSGPNAEKGMWMGVGVGDFDHDGCLDFVSSNLASDQHFEHAQPQIIRGKCHDEEPGFVMEDLDIAPFEGRDDLTLFAWGPIARDFDNDGNLDFYWSGNYGVLIHPAFRLASLKQQGLLPLDATLADLALLEASASSNPEADVVVNKEGPEGRRLMMEHSHSPGEFFYGQGPDADHEFRLEYSPANLTFDYNIIMTSGDYNGDGALDIVVAIDNSVPGTRGGRPLVLYGEPNGNHWLGVRLEGTGPNTSRQAVGAVAHLTRKDGSGLSQTLILSAGSAAMSTEEKTLFFGIGSDDVSDYAVTITWPGSREQEVFDGFTQPEIVTLVQGEGRAVKPSNETKEKCKSLAWICEIVEMFSQEEP